MNAQIAPIVMLLASNVFMTFAWYGHLKYLGSPLWIAVVCSWGIAFFEYWLAVPANRIGHAVYATAQLKTMQEVITLIVFAGFSVLYLREPFTWNYVIGFAFIATGAYFVFNGPIGQPWQPPQRSRYCAICHPLLIAKSPQSPPPLELILTRSPPARSIANAP